MGVICRVCANEYEAIEDNCPYCLANNVDKKVFLQPKYFRWVGGDVHPEEKVCNKSSITSSINYLVYNIQKPMSPYTMDGAQSAHTSVMRRNGQKLEFSTKDGMHSEMVAVQYMLGIGEWRMYLGNIVDSDGQAISEGSFKTTEPHCGYCTIMLQVLGLPHSKPTAGNHNYACNFNYPVPETIKKDPYVVARLLGKGSYCAFNEIKKIVNSFISASPETWVLKICEGVIVNDYHYIPDAGGRNVLTWSELLEKSGGEILRKIWVSIFSSIYEINKNSK